MEASGNESRNGEGTYVYGVIGRSVELPPLGGAAPRAVAEGDLKALVGSVSLDDWSGEVLATQEAVAERAQAHQAALEPLLECCTPLPMRLGTILRSDDDVRTLLRRAHDRMAEALRTVEGRQEWGIKLIVDRTALARRVEAQDSELRALAGRIERASEGTRYMLEKRRQRVAEELVDQESTRLARLVRDAVAGVAERRAVLAARDGCALNDSLLLPRDRGAALARQVEALEVRLDGLATIHLTGPWPPYSFAPLIELGEEQLSVER